MQEIRAECDELSVVLDTGKEPIMPDRPLLVTTTGEPFQPARLHYAVRDHRRLESCLRELECVGFDKGRNRWVWHFDAEASSLKFKRSWKDVSKHGPVVLGYFYIRAPTRRNFTCDPSNGH